MINLIFFLPTFIYGGAGNSIYRLCKNLDKRKYKIDIISLEDLYAADEVFYCGSASEVTPIRTIDNHQIGNGEAGELTLKLQEKYYDIVRGKHEKYFSWLTFIK